MSAVDYCICIEELARVDPSIALSVAAHNGLVRGAHLRCSAPRRRSSGTCVPLAQRREARRLGADRSRAPAATPPRMRTTARARRRRLGAQRLEDSSSRTAASADVMVVMAVTDRDAGPPAASRRSSSSAARRGCTPGKKEDKLGMRASDTSEVHLRGLPRAGRRSCSARRARGSSTRCRCSTPGRIGIAALAVGLAQGAYEAARALRARAPPVRPADRRVPGDPVEARRQRHAHRGGAAADVSRGVPEGPGRAGRRSSRRWRSSTRARSPCRPPTTACRSTAATAS